MYNPTHYPLLVLALFVYRDVAVGAGRMVASQAAGPPPAGKVVVYADSGRRAAERVKRENERCTPPRTKLPAANQRRNRPNDAGMRPVVTAIAAAVQRTGGWALTLGRCAWPGGEEQRPKTKGQQRYLDSSDVFFLPISSIPPTRGSRARWRRKRGSLAKSDSSHKSSGELAGLWLAQRPNDLWQSFLDNPVRIDVFSDAQHEAEVFVIHSE